MNSKYNLKWDDFQSQILDIHHDWRNSANFHDILLVCCDNKSGCSQSKVFKAHKLLLCSASSVFNEILSSSTNVHNGYHTPPLSSLYMHGVSPEVLHCILDFIYCGEVCVGQENLDAFMSVAEKFNIKGLTDGNQDITSSNPVSNEQYKSEPVIVDSEKVIRSDDSLFTEGANASVDPLPDHYEDSVISTFKNDEDSNLFRGDLSTEGWCNDIEESDSNNDSDDRKRKRDFVDANCTQTDKGFFCLLCNVSLSSKGNQLRHFNEKHFDTHLSYCCPMCQSIHQVKRRFKSHIQRCHPDLVGADLSKFAVQKNS